MAGLWQKWLGRPVDAARIRKAIEAAERHTSGEIVVSLSPFFVGSVEAAARRAFERVGISRTRERNGVLFFVVVGRRQFEILGDEGIHRAVGQAFWDDVARAAAARLRAGDLTGGLVAAIEAVGFGLATHFPFDATRDVNELTDDVVLGSKGV